MPPTLANGKVCYIEMPATDIRSSADFYPVSYTHLTLPTN